MPLSKVAKPGGEPVARPNAARAKPRRTCQTRAARARSKSHAFHDREGFGTPSGTKPFAIMEKQHWPNAFLGSAESRTTLAAR
jgi:hypothetical protein